MTYRAEKQKSIKSRNQVRQKYAIVPMAELPELQPETLPMDMGDKEMVAL